MSRPSKHNPLTKSYAIDQITDIEYLRKVAHRMWEAFSASHEQHAHTLGALLSGECKECVEYMDGDRIEGCREYRELQRKVTDGFGSI